jgi:predicted Zn-dependent peptidase
MKKKKLAIVCFVIWLLIQTSSFAAKQEYTTKILANGTRVIYKVLPNVKTVTTRIVVPTGFLTEQHELRGISHLLEHLIYRGNERITPAEFHRLVDDQGGSYNGFTNINRTEYLLEISPEKLIPALKAYLDMLMCPGLAESDITLEKKIVSVEKAMRTIPGNTFFLYLNELTEMQFEDSVKTISREDLLQYHQRFYCSDRLTVIITGAFDPAEIFKLFAENPSASSKPYAQAITLPLQVTQSDVILEDYLQGEKYQLLVGFDLKELSKKELLVAKVLPDILSYETRQYDHQTDRPLDYQIFLINLNTHYFLIFQYRDCLTTYSPQINAWHQKNLERYFKYLGAKKFNNFLSSLVRSYDQLFETLDQDSYRLNDYYVRTLFDPTTISDRDLSAIRSLSSNDFKAFVQKYLSGQPYHKIVINAL